MMQVTRGARRTRTPDVFVSHTSRDKDAALKLAKTLNFCAVDVWLDDWELEIGQSLTEKIAKAMDESRFIAILITTNYNKTVWTKTEYKKALAREQREGRVVMLPIVVGEAEVPAFLEDKIYIDLRQDFFTGVVKLVGLVHGISSFRISQALRENKPERVKDVWRLLESVGFKPYVVLGEDDFQEALKYGGELVTEGYATFYPSSLLQDDRVTGHVQALMSEIADERGKAFQCQANVRHALGIAIDIDHRVTRFPQPTNMTCWSAAATMLFGNMSVGKRKHVRGLLWRPRRRFPADDHVHFASIGVRLMPRRVHSAAQVSCLTSHWSRPPTASAAPTLPAAAHCGR